ncbi:MAG: ribosome recycling factor [Christensenellaceae bacterium]|jgi:ribosome recycling factor|nr:ribosome recycling factor [Christensenellaceae bacterium]
MDYLSEAVNIAMLEFEDNLANRSEHLSHEFALIRAGRVNTGIVERVSVEYFGTPTPLKNLANISCSDARTIVINLWDTAILREASRALSKAELGTNPIDDGRVIRMIFPQLTEERRKELAKQVRKIAEETRITMRNDRRNVMDAIKKIKTAEKLSEDDVKSIETDIQKQLDSYIATVDKLLAKKESEIMEI